ncbi:MAG: NUDIX hydrolase [Dehalococcoidales bacterium]|nr:NUDIX hydrolase [Dehalococcoidales bacterium]
MTSAAMPIRPMIRAASALIEDGRILLLKQEVTPTRHWALPGGRLEMGETLAECIAREMKEETGLDARVKELLYITDRIIQQAHIVHILFLVERLKNNILPMEWTHLDPAPSGSSDRIREMKMVPITELSAYGFSTRWQQLVRGNFPGRGKYQGDFYTFYGEK